MNHIHAKEINFSYSNETFLKNISLTIQAGKMISIIGPNGSGKSTLVKLLAASILPQSGHVFLNELPILKMKRKELAKKIAYLSQSPVAPDDLTVRQLVQYGRYAHQSYFKNTKNNDENIVNWALQVTGLTNFAENCVFELSGGQRQRAWIGMALAQNSQCLFLDELTTYLDIRHQIEILNLLKNINQEQKKTIVMVHHDLNHAIHYSEEIIVMADGKIKAFDKVQNILESKILNSVFNIEFKCFFDQNKRPILFYSHTVA
ncbi:ABC transporter ATP-binding protein [Pigmentibacter sp. JX0631]|uniref:ABC transporter ATP-binding protein n=1 Tax=Pigmentibacter sp. JX0631 TaxID=2976982 RepID=UPI0024685C5B|nr:ABC transporter ATP-binding protein [Pigmentibacter sp. JX0631]WGL59255.1 ABC transporter ATP-binding protein [Pigmentibacter sp. JX0631]